MATLFAILKAFPPSQTPLPPPNSGKYRVGKYAVETVPLEVGTHTVAMDTSFHPYNHFLALPT